MAFKNTLKQLFSSYSQSTRYSDEALEEHLCPNCGHVFKGNYCPVCSQGAGDGHITWKWVGKNILDVWGIDTRSLPNTLLQLLWRPGHLISDYIGGHRQVCYKPVNMLFIVALVYVVLMQIIGHEVNLDIINVEGGDKDGYFKMINAGYYWMMTHPGWAMMILTMIMILPTWIVFRFAPRHSRLTLPENIFVQLFMSTLMLIVAFTISVSNGRTLFLIPIYYYISYRQLFGYKFWGTTWRLAVCFLVWLILITYIIISVLVIVVQQYESKNPFLASVFGVVEVTLATTLLVAIPLSIAYFISRKTAKRRQQPSL